MDLALNNLLWLICHKTKQIKKTQKTPVVESQQKLDVLTTNSSDD